MRAPARAVEKAVNVDIRDKMDYWDELTEEEREIVKQAASIHWKHINRNRRESTIH